MGKKPPAILLEASEEEAKRLLAALKKARESLKSRVRPGEPVIPGEPAIKRRACSLLERYYYYDVGPPKILLQLIADCMGVEANPFVTYDRDIPTRNYEAWDRAIFFEAEHKPDTDNIKPSTASENAVAKAAFPQSDDEISPHRKTVKEWRQHDDYRGEVDVARWFLENNSHTNEK